LLAYPLVSIEFQSIDNNLSTSKKLFLPFQLL
jgi:hypothetical protein